MTPHAFRSILFGLVLGWSFAGAVRAEDQPVFETLDDWKVVTNADAKASPRCMLQRVYQEEGEKGVTSIVAAREGESVALALGYSNWDHGSEHPKTIVLLLNDRIVDKRSRWSADQTQLVATIPPALVPALIASNSIVLRFKDGDATFRTPRFGEAFAVLQRCDQPPPPTQVRLDAYAAGLMFQGVLAACDVSSTARQRSELDVKVAALKPEMVAVEKDLRAEIEKSLPKTCTAQMTETIASRLQLYVALSPEGFIGNP